MILIGGYDYMINVDHSLTFSQSLEPIVIVLFLV